LHNLVHLRQALGGLRGVKKLENMLFLTIFKMLIALQTNRIKREQLLYV
jgi:hypothetical protein